MIVSAQVMEGVTISHRRLSCLYTNAWESCVFRRYE